MTTIQEIHFSRISGGLFERLCDTYTQMELSGRDMNRMDFCMNRSKLFERFENTKPRGKAYSRLINKHLGLTS